MEELMKTHHETKVMTKGNETITETRNENSNGKHHEKNHEKK